MFLILEHVIEVYNYTDVEEIQENIVYEPLKNCQSISQAKKYYYSFKISIPSLESHLLLIVFYNPH